MKETKPTYKKQGNVTLFDSDETMEKLNKLGNPLDKLSKAVDFEMFRDTLEKGLYKEKFTKVGVKPYDYVLMFKIVVLQRIYHLSDPQAEYQIRDRLSFRDFLGLASGDKVPDEKTIWAFKEELTKKGLFGQLFNEFYAFLEENNLILHEGTMIDGSFVEAPRQHNTREENKQIKEGKGGEKHYSHKNHAKVDKGSKFIKGGTCVRVHGRVPSRNVQPSGRLCAERGLQHPDKPGLQPAPVRASHATRNELNKPTN
jgi:transposase